MFEFRLAVGRDGNRIIPVDNARVYNSLPTELKLGFNFLFRRPISYLMDHEVDCMM